MHQGGMERVGGDILDAPSYGAHRDWIEIVGTGVPDGPRRRRRRHGGSKPPPYGVAIGGIEL